MPNCEIDLHDLFDAVTEDYFYYKAAYRRACADPGVSVEQLDARRLQYEKARQELERVSALMGVDLSRLIALHRLLFRWGRVRRWARIFPMKDHYTAIVQYVTTAPACLKGVAV